MAERVLIVDDNMMMRQILSAQLIALGFTNVCKAVNGVDAMNQLLGAIEQNDPFRIILLDWNMPEMNGYDFLQQCRQDKRFDRTAIVMVAAEGEQQNIVKALETGATSYLVKPYVIDALDEKMKQVAQWLDKANASGQSAHA
jgi:two-component system chemotaxis response regulator CheY